MLQHAVDCANPAPLGFFAFSLTTALYMTSQAGLTEAATQCDFPLGICFGGLTMLIVAILEMFRRNTLGATVFGTFGAFWIAIEAVTVMPSDIKVAQAQGGGNCDCLSALFGVAAIGFMCVSVAYNLALPLVFLMIGIMFFLLSAGTTRPNIAKAAGWWGIFTSVLAFYIGMAILFEESWGREILPL
ncbi:hypothetical protein CHLNCDRAFT_22572, partial [Chlorella variabilis]